MAKPISGGLTPFTKMLVNINDDLTPDDVENLKDMCSLSEILPDSELNSVRNGLSLFKLLRQRNRLSESDTSLLNDLLLNIKRNDLIKKYLTADTGLNADEAHTPDTPAAVPVAGNELHAIQSRNSDIDTSQQSLAGVQGGDIQADGFPDDVTVISKTTPFKTSIGKKSPDPSTITTTTTTTTGASSSSGYDAPKIPTELRNYQRELARPALDGKNTIICAPTGCGKTITAAEICKHHYDISPDPKKFKALFIVNIRHLTSQQREAFSTHFDTRDLGALKDTETLQAILNVKKVVMITAQILVNALERNEVELSSFDMLIFDECHHTTLNHPYNTIMRNYLLKRKEGRCRLPFILGLSASLGVGADGDAANHIITLCANMNAKCVSHVRENLEDLKHHVRTPEDDIICIVSPRPHNDEFRSNIESIMLDQECRFVGEAPSVKGSQEYESWIVQVRMNAEKLQDRDDTVISGYLQEFNNALMLYDNTRAIDAIEHLDYHFKYKRSINKEYIESEATLRFEYETNCEPKLRDFEKKESTADCPKLKKLTELLKTIFEANIKSKGIILCRTRSIVKCLKNFLGQEEALRKYDIKPDLLVGQGNSEKQDTLKETEQAKVLKRFRDGKINILVATDIAQEGLDMPACNVVIRFNFVSNEIGTVQSRGRARASGKCYLIVETGSRNEKHEHTNREKVARMEEALMNVDRQSEMQFNEDVRKRQDELIEKYEKDMLKEKETQQLDRATDVRVLCKECSAFLCHASDLRASGSNITCVGSEFRNRIREFEKKTKDEYRDTVTLGLIKCAGIDCGQQLGILILFKGGTEHRGYGLKAQSFKFENPKKRLNTTWTIKKWKKKTFEIKQLEL